MEKSIVAYVQKLDDGFIIEKDGKTRAIEKEDSVIGILKSYFEEMIRALANAQTKDMRIEIKTETNFPKNNPCQ